MTFNSRLTEKLAKRANKQKLERAISNLMREFEDGQEVVWTDPSENLKLKAKVDEFIPEGSPCGFSKSTCDVYFIELLEDHPNGVRHKKGEKIFVKPSEIE